MANKLFKIAFITISAIILFSCSDDNNNEELLNQPTIRINGEEYVLNSENDIQGYYDSQEEECRFVLSVYYQGISQKPLDFRFILKSDRMPQIGDEFYRYEKYYYNDIIFLYDYTYDVYLGLVYGYENFRYNGGTVKIIDMDYEKGTMTLDFQRLSMSLYYINKEPYEKFTYTFTGKATVPFDFNRL